MKINRGIIKGFSATHGSGIASLSLITEKGFESIPCDNGATCRAIDHAFPGFIIPGHRVDPSIIIDKEIFWWYDDLSLCLGGFAPVCPETEIQYQHYREQNETESEKQ